MLQKCLSVAGCFSVWSILLRIDGYNTKPAPRNHSPFPSPLLLSDSTEPPWKAFSLQFPPIPLGHNGLVSQLLQNTKGLELGSCELVDGCGESPPESSHYLPPIPSAYHPHPQLGLGASELKRGKGGVWLKEQVWRSRARSRGGGLRNNLLVYVWLPKSVTVWASSFCL